MSSDEQTFEALGMLRDATPGLLDRMARGMLLKSLSSITSGRVTLLDSGRCLAFGDANADLSATVRVHHPAFYRQVAFGGTIGAGEAYMDGVWECDDLPALVRIMVRNREAQARLEGGLARPLIPVRRLLHRLNDNTRIGSRRNIAAHYDLGNDFYQLFLDPTMTYSCGIFERPDSTMEEASVAKFDRICRKLHLAPGMSLLEIGTGWGGFAIHAARNYGCRITTTTISRQQHELAEQRFRQAGLDGQITLLQQDYRDLSGQFDRLVSIEMIEAVGHRHLPAFFRVCGRRLKPDGIGLIQSHHHAGSRLRCLQGHPRLHQLLHLSRRLLPIADGHVKGYGSHDRPAPGPPGGSHPPLRPHLESLAQRLPLQPGTGSRTGLPGTIHPDVGILPVPL